MISEHISPFPSFNLTNGQNSCREWEAYSGTCKHLKKNNHTIKLKQYLELIILPLFSKTDLVTQNLMGPILKQNYLGIYLQLPTLPEGKQSGGCSPIIRIKFISIHTSMCAYLCMWH